MSHKFLVGVCHLENMGLYEYQQKFEWALQKFQGTEHGYTLGIIQGNLF